MLSTLRKAIERENNDFFVLESVTSTDDKVKDIFLDDPEADVLGAEDDPEIDKLIQMIPEYEYEDEELLEELEESLLVTEI